MPTEMARGCSATGHSMRGVSHRDCWIIGRSETTGVGSSKRARRRSNEPACPYYIYHTVFPTRRAGLPRACPVPTGERSGGAPCQRRSPASPKVLMCLRRLWGGRGHRSAESGVLHLPPFGGTLGACPCSSVDRAAASGAVCGRSSRPRGTCLHAMACRPWTVAIRLKRAPRRRSRGGTREALRSLTEGQRCPIDPCC